MGDVCELGPSHATEHMWRLRVSFVDLILSFYLYTGSWLNSCPQACATDPSTLSSLPSWFLLLTFKCTEMK